ncbi:MAG: hypothetical protein FWF08_00610 [Oscillospiraceae bacterium]|nr:hypothetical protein [Oscillospiraceae bacterium]
MKYYKLMYDYEGDDNWVVCNDNDVGGTDYIVMTYGVPFNGWKNDFYFGYDPDDGTNFTDYLDNSKDWLAVSKKFMDLTKGLIKDSVQAFPIKVVNIKDKSENFDYTVLNIVDLVDGLDLENSVYRVIKFPPGFNDDHTFNSIIKYAIKGETVGGHHIFRLKDSDAPIFVSETLKDIIQKNNLTGFDFLEIKVS